MKVADILKRPIITERSLRASAKGVYTFAVGKKATKSQVKKAIEEQFKVEVVSVRTLNYKGKKRRVGRRRIESQLKDFKKALVKLKEGDKIDVFETQEREKG